MRLKKIDWIIGLLVSLPFLAALPPGIPGQ